MPRGVMPAALVELSAVSVEVLPVVVTAKPAMLPVELPLTVRLAT